MVLTPPTLTLWLTGVRTSSATTPDIKPSALSPLGSSRALLAPAAYFASQNVPVWAQCAVMPLVCVCVLGVQSSLSRPLFPFDATVLCLTSCKRNVMLSVGKFELLGEEA